jgi:hypothetical protein
VYVGFGLNLVVFVCAQMLVAIKRLAANKVTGKMLLIRIGLDLCYEIDLK